MSGLRRPNGTGGLKLLSDTGGLSRIRDLGDLSRTCSTKDEISKKGKACGLGHPLTYRVLGDTGPESGKCCHQEQGLEAV